MDLFTILGTCLRRWYVVLPVLAISGYFAMQAYEQVESQYTASTSIVILPSQSEAGVDPESEVPTLDNPYAGSGGPKLAAAVLAKNIDSSAFRDRLGLTPTDTSTFEASVSQSQPIITVDAIASTPEATLATLDAVTESARVVLDEFQAVAEAPEAKRYLVAAAVPASSATDVTPSRWRTAGAILVIGTILGMILAVAVDGALRRRSDRTLAEPEQTRDDIDGIDGIDGPVTGASSTRPVERADVASAEEETGEPRPRGRSGRETHAAAIPRARTSLRQDT